MYAFRFIQKMVSLHDFDSYVKILEILIKMLNIFDILILGCQVLNIKTT